MPNYPTNDEYLAQTNENIFDVAQKALDLAVALLLKLDSGEQEALNIIKTYGDWKQLDLPDDIRRKFYVANYGEDEVLAMEEAGEVRFDIAGVKKGHIDGRTN